MPRRKPAVVKPSCDTCGEDLEGPCPACNKMFCAECASELGGFCHGCEKLFCGCYAGRMRVVSWDRHLMDDCEECEQCRLQPSGMDRVAIKYDLPREPAALPFYANQKALVDTLLSSTNLATFFTLPTPTTAQTVKRAFLCARRTTRESRHPQRHAALLLLQRLKRKAMDLAHPPPPRARSFRTFNDGLSDEEYEEGLYDDAANDDIDIDDGYDWAGAWAAAATMLVRADAAEADATYDGDPRRTRRFLLRAAAAPAGPSAVKGEPIGPVTAAEGPSVGQKRGHAEV